MRKGYDLQFGHEMWKHLENIHRFGYSSPTIFGDFLDVCLLSLLALTENLQHADILEQLQQNRLTGTYETAYMRMVEKYTENKTTEKGKRPIDSFANAWGALLKETGESGQDILGEIFMAKISLGEQGQFFTPQHVSDMMAQLVTSDTRLSRETVCDPCCGSGRFFISVSKVNRNAHFYGVDLSPTCAKMAALNMWLFDLDADIFHGDSLAMRLFHVWNIRRGGFLFESAVEEHDAPLPESIRTTLKTQAEQQKLFDFDGNEESQERKEVKR